MSDTETAAVTNFQRTCDEPILTKCQGVMESPRILHPISVASMPTVLLSDMPPDEEDEGPEMTEEDEAALTASMIVMGALNIITVIYVTTEAQANTELAAVVEGAVGFDTEFVKRTLYGDEKIIDDMPTMSPSAKKTARLAIQYLKSRSPLFGIDWTKTGLCLVQIAQGEVVWVLNMNRIKSYPSQLRRILESDNIAKTGAGIASDGFVIWEDLRTNTKNLVDVGLMTRLWGVNKRKDEPYSNLALETAAAEILEITIDKTYQKNVDWKVEPNKAQIIYAAIDAAAALRLHKILTVELAQDEVDFAVKIPTDWYTFNFTLGEAMRTRKSVRDVEIPWSMKDCTWFSNNKFQGRYY
ncbi:ribonuclease H-like domain-containing protein [Mycena metata]|uniref:3'-5' exonuclease n=1 Tax=Mycena metata TaxID=1033252 RepID=A0AAD7JPG2_9AGAR|nr:ribonuclease H-like domain-containing protein [Mycena metata]